MPDDEKFIGWDFIFSANPEFGEPVFRPLDEITYDPKSSKRLVAYALKPDQES